MTASHFWVCARPGCGGMVWRPPGELAECPRCGEEIVTDLRARVETTKSEAQARKRTRKRSTRRAAR